MGSQNDQGLLAAVLIYMAAILGVLALIADPIYLAIGPTVIQNAGARDVHRLLAVRGHDEAFPVARLEPATIIEPEQLAQTKELNARAKQEERQVRQAQLAQRAQRNRSKMRTARRAQARSIAASRPVSAARSRAPFRRQYGAAPYY